MLGLALRDLQQILHVCDPYNIIEHLLVNDQPGELRLHQ